MKCVVEYSILTNEIRIGMTADMLTENWRESFGSVVSDFRPIAMFNTYQECYDYEAKVRELLSRRNDKYTEGTNEYLASEVHRLNTELMFQREVFDRLSESYQKLATSPITTQPTDT